MRAKPNPTSRLAFRRRAQARHPPALKSLFPGPSFVPALAGIRQSVVQIRALGNSDFVALGELVGRAAALRHILQRFDTEDLRTVLVRLRILVYLVIYDSG